MNAIISIHINQSNNNAMTTTLKTAEGYDEGMCRDVYIEMSIDKHTPHLLDVKTMPLDKKTDTCGYPMYEHSFTELRYARIAFTKQCKLYNATVDFDNTEVLSKK